MKKIILTAEQRDRLCSAAEVVARFPLAQAAHDYLNQSGDPDRTLKTLGELAQLVRSADQVVLKFESDQVGNDIVQVARGGNVTQVAHVTGGGSSIQIGRATGNVVIRG